MTEILKKAIHGLLVDCVDRALDRVSSKSDAKPFHEALLTTDVLLMSAFERSFSTSFGQKGIEQMSKLIAREYHIDSDTQYKSEFDIPESQMNQIDRILRDLRSGSSKPNWTKELKSLKCDNDGSSVKVVVKSDLWIKKSSGDSYYSIKTVKPNIDQTEIAKKDMLKLLAENDERSVFFALYYNPFGASRSDYSWTIPNKVFDMKSDECVLIGSDYWDNIGQEGTYADILKIFASAGDECRKLIKKKLK